MSMENGGRLFRNCWRASALMRVAVVAGSIALAGCTEHVLVRPDASPLLGGTHVRPLKVDLNIDPQVASFQTVARTSTLFAGTGFHTALEVTFEIGPALAETIDRAVRGHFQEVHRTQVLECGSGTDGVIAVAFAKPPSVGIRWVQHMFGAGGGATAELAVSVVVRRCDGTIVWRGVAQGFGSADVVKLLKINDKAQCFQPALHQALAELARTLNADLATADLAGLGSTRP
jgi:hypothetical protein